MACVERYARCLSIDPIALEVRSIERWLPIDGQPKELAVRAFAPVLALIERGDRAVTKNEPLDPRKANQAAMASLTVALDRVGSPFQPFTSIGVLHEIRADSFVRLVVR